MGEFKKKGRPYIAPMFTIVSVNDDCPLLRTSVKGDHESADDDDAYAKPNSGLFDLDETEWKSDDVAY